MNIHIPQTPPEGITVREAARLMGVGTNRVLQLVADGRLPVLRRLDGSGHGYLLERGPVIAYARGRLERLHAATEAMLSGGRMMKFGVMPSASTPLHHDPEAEDLEGATFYPGRDAKGRDVVFYVTLSGTVKEMREGNTPRELTADETVQFWSAVGVGK